jgi:inorganic pyrophosphatase
MAGPCSFHQDWRVWLEKDGDPISFWHDIPLYPDPKDKSVIYYYTEIPRWTDAKVETKRDEPLSMPIDP